MNLYEKALEREEEVEETIFEEIIEEKSLVATRWLRRQES